MGGGLMQLVAYGAQDIYLTGNPQITFFKVVYRRHTNFAVESIEQTFNGQIDFGQRVSATIARNGDLIQQMYLEVILPNVTVTDGSPYWTYGVGNAMIKQVEIEIGGQLIDRQYGEWMDIWSELSVPAGKRRGYDDMVGNWMNHYNNQWTGVSAATGEDTPSGENVPGGNYKNIKLYIPFQFWFNRNPGLALPLIALQYHEVKLNLEIRPIGDLVNGAYYHGLTGPVVADGSQSFKLYVDYVYLDTDERRRFAQVSHEYLIEQVQFTGDESVSADATSKNFTLNFNHPVKELIWVHVSTIHASSGLGSRNNRWLDFGPYHAARYPDCDTFGYAKLQLNGHDRFSVREADYFRKVQNYEHHTNVPRCPTVGEYENSPNGAPGHLQYIYTYSFALSPEEHQPSGTCNFSRIDNAVLQINYIDRRGNNTTHDSPMNLKVFAVNYNILRIMSGMGGLAFSN